MKNGTEYRYRDLFYDYTFFFFVYIIILVSTSTNQISPTHAKEVKGASQKDTFAETKDEEAQALRGTLRLAACRRRGGRPGAEHLP